MRWWQMSILGWIILGGLIGGFLFSLIGGAKVTGFNLWSLFVSVVGALIFIAIVRALRRA
jgi:uncharacterized membrane protein YeaQ/YmgE (transglycosylase-associated protein family)